MSHLDEFVPEAQSSSRVAFAAKHPNFFLVLKLERQERQEEWSFQTRTITTARLGKGAGRLGPEAERFRVFPLLKMARNPWPERISAGRARNNDVVLPDSSISKLHAHFVKDPAGTMHIVDAGSRNGTLLGERRLVAGERTAVAVGDRLQMGGLVLDVLDAEGLYDLVHAQLHR